MRLTFSFALLGLSIAGSAVATDFLRTETRKTQETCLYETPTNPTSQLLGFGPPWDPQCTLCGVAGEEACLGQPCWCVPEGGTEGCCPDPGERPLTYEWQVPDGFRANLETLSDPILFTPVGCEPLDTNIATYYPNAAKCDAFPLVDNADAVCAFIYKEDDTDCGGLDPREYGLQSFESYDAAILAGAVPTHLGACGVCSNAADLASFLNPQPPYDLLRGLCAQFAVPDAVAAAAGQQVRDGLLYECYIESMGLSPDCAFMHATSDIAGSVPCEEVCIPVLAEQLPPNLYETCDLNLCLECDNGPHAEYLRWAGRDLYNSGIIAYTEFYHSKRDCDVYLNNPIVLQDPYNPTTTLTDPTPNVAESADRFSPSYSVLLDQEICVYDFSFSVKHDSTLPNGGGWDPNNPNSVTREEFDALCARDTEVIASDGKPYRERRMHHFQFGEDVKVITGIFDHISIDYNPCGHHDTNFFGRPHYDFHFYLVQEQWRDIMKCDTTVCDPQECKFDDVFQSSESGKSFFDMGRCSDPFPSSIPADATLAPGLPPILPGFFNRNMPFGFGLVPNAGNVRSGMHSLNIDTASRWNETQVDRWDGPIQFFMSFNDNIVVWEPMVPVEFLQGSESRSFSTPETPPLCQTLAGLPLTYDANYNPDNGFTTYQIMGVSPICACLINPDSGALTSDQCAANDAELAKYADTYAQFTNGGVVTPPTPPTSPFGKFSVSEVEAAFGFNLGSLILKGTAEFDMYTANNFWVEFIGLPLILNRLTQIVATPRNDFQALVGGFGAPTFLYQEDNYYEQPLLGCFYAPKPEETDLLLQESGLGLCTEEPGALTGIIVPYWVVAYIDQYTRLLYFGTLPEFANDIQFLTQLVVAEIQKDAPLADGEAFVYQLKGPSFGEYAGFSDPDIADPTFIGNHGHFEVAVLVADLNEPCPDEFCGDFGSPAIPNELAPDAPWPTKVLDYQCSWFPCAEIEACEGFVEDPNDTSFFRLNDFEDQCGRTFIEFVDDPTSAPTPAPSGAGAVNVLGALAMGFLFALFF